MIKIKICGITNLEDAVSAVEFGADAVGFIFFKESPRYISPADAAQIIKKLPSFVSAVGVFVNEGKDIIESVIAKSGIDLIQLHGDEPPGFCNFTRRVIKAIRVESPESLKPLESYREHVSAFLLDTYSHDMMGGTGIVFNWDIAREAKKYGSIVLAGGLTPENISEAVRLVRPYAVDVSSGVELRKGKKDHSKLRLFIERARAAA